jgi:hypothetical protein
MADTLIDTQAETTDTITQTDGDGPTGTMSVEKVEPAPRKTPRPRNYSHLDRNPETMDDVEGKDGKTYKVPATMGSMYWAILVCMYENVNSPVYPSTLVKRVDEVMREQDEVSWDEYCNKTNTTVWKRGKGEREVQQIKSVAERTINNAKTLTRYKDYGKRLYELQHIMRMEYDGKAQPYFILYTNLDCLKKKEKATTDGK